MVPRAEDLGHGGADACRLIEGAALFEQLGDVELTESPFRATVT